MAKKVEYEIKGVTTKISATSRCAIKVSDNYYTIEASEERSLPPEVDSEKEWTALFDSVNSVVDAQCQEILDTFAKKKR